MNRTVGSGSAFAAAPFIKEIGRGKNAARSLARADARALYAAMLDGRISDLELGAVWMAMRIKGESVEELAGFLDAAEAAFEPLAAPPGAFAPVVLPSYNGARQLPNLTPLLALMLAREGVPVLVHGVTADPGRVTSAEIFAALGIEPAADLRQAQSGFAARRPVFMPVEALAPRLAHLLSLRRIIGVRSSIHTLVKIMQPFAAPALRLVSYTHPEYHELLTGYFTQAADPARGEVFLMRGTEGEPVANAKRGRQIEWLHDGRAEVLMEAQEASDTQPDMPAGRDPTETAQWIQAALRGERPIPAAIAEQARHCLQATRRLARPHA